MSSGPAWPGYEPSPHFRMMTAIGLVGVLVLAVGAVLFAHFEPIGPASGARTTVTVKQYDAASGRPTGSARTTFTSRQVPSAIVAWDTLPGSLVVEAGWFDESGFEVASTGVHRADRQPDLLPMATERDAEIPSGSYTFAVGRFSDGRIVEVLARAEIQVSAA